MFPIASECRQIRGSRSSFYAAWRPVCFWPAIMINVARRTPVSARRPSPALCEDRLAVVIGQMGSSAKQACVPVAVWFSDEVFVRNALVPLQPFRWGELLEFGPEHEIQFSPDLDQL